METLRGVFPAVPTEALLRVLDVCDQSVALASSWLLENDWQDLMPEADEETDDVQEVVPPAPNVAPEVNLVTVSTEAAAGGNTETESTPAAAEQARTMVVSTEVRVTGGDNREQNVAQRPLMARRSTGLYPFQEEELDSEDEDDAAGNEEGDEDEDEDEEDMYDDSGDEAGFRVGGVTPLSNRVKITPSEAKAAADEDFWVAFDDQVMTKSMIELLNTTLSKLAHRKVVLLNRPAKEIGEAEASVKIRSILPAGGSVAAKDDTVADALQSPRDASNRGGISLARLLHGGIPKATPRTQESGKVSCSSESPTAITPEVSAGQKRKRKAEAEDDPRRGFFAYFFPVRELDMVWRTVMHAHLFKARFGETIEFHTASGGAFSKHDFDELMHIQTSAASSRAASLGFSPLSSLKCCLLLPCPTDEDEMLRVGQNIHSVLKVQGSLYYRVNDSSKERSRLSPQGVHFELPSDDDKLTEERFRQFARYRVKEEAVANEGPKPSHFGVDPYMSYQQPRKSSYSLEKLETDKWNCRLSS